MYVDWCHPKHPPDAAPASYSDQMAINNPAVIVCRPVEQTMGFIESLMLCGFAESDAVPLFVWGRKLLDITIGVHAKATLAFDISVPAGEADEGKYGASFNIREEDLKIIEFLQRELQRMLSGYRLCKIAIPPTEDKYAHRVTSRVDETTIITKRMLNGQTQVASIADLTRGRCINAILRLSHIRTRREDAGTFNAYLHVHHVEIFERDDTVGIGGFPLLNDPSCFQIASNVNLLGTSRDCNDD